MNKAVVLFSGGQDSTTCLAWAKKDYEVYALTIDYGQRHSKEVDCARKIAKEWHVPLIVYEMPSLAPLVQSALLDPDLEIKDGDKFPNTFMPGRNMLFFTLAGAYAYQIGAPCRWRHVSNGL